MSLTRHPVLDGYGVLRVDQPFVLGRAFDLVRAALAASGVASPPAGLAGFGPRSPEVAHYVGLIAADLWIDDNRRPFRSASIALAAERPASANALSDAEVTSDDVLGKVSNPSQYAETGTAVLAAGLALGWGLAEADLGKIFAPSRYLETFDLSSDLLPSTVTAVEAVRLGVAPVFEILSVTDNGSVLSPMDYELVNGLSLENASAANWVGPLVVDYRAGYALADDPGDNGSAPALAASVPVALATVLQGWGSQPGGRALTAVSDDGVAKVDFEDAACPLPTMALEQMGCPSKKELEQIAEGAQEASGWLDAVRQGENTLLPPEAAPAGQGKVSVSVSRRKGLPPTFARPCGVDRGCTEREW